MAGKFDKVELGGDAAMRRIVERQRAQLVMAMEIGYRLCEKGHNLEMARILFAQLMDKPEEGG